MAKKDFSTAAANAFVSKMTTPTEPAAPKRKPTHIEAMAEQVDKPAKIAEERITMIIDSIAVEKMRTIAWQDKRKLKDVFAAAMNMFIADYEAKNGIVKTR